MNILFVAAECAPFAKVGGLGDVIGTLPVAITRQGHSVRVILPHYGSIDDAAYGITPADRFAMRWNSSVTTVEVAKVEQNGVVYYFLHGWPFFSPQDKFVYSSDEGIDVGRYLFLSAATLRFLASLARNGGWSPDLIHAHDWHTATLPYLLSRMNKSETLLRKTGSLFSIHNMQYQGWGVGWHFSRAGIPLPSHPLLRALGKTDNSLAVGLATSTMLGTVSPTYAQEITTPAGGYGLDGLVHARYTHLVGVLNGIDVERWDPRRSSQIRRNFDESRLDERRLNKSVLQHELGLPEQPDAVLIGAVMRLVEQKGPRIMFPALRAVLAKKNIQFVLLGTGQAEFESEARQLEREFPSNVAVRLGYDEALSERVYAGSDLFLMPSLFEPCGIGQMIAMRYGALPVVRKVGGLADTVDETTGFTFKEFDSRALAETLDQALQVFEHEQNRWRAMQVFAMQRDFSWERSARQYLELYEQTANLHRLYRVRSA